MSASKPVIIDSFDFQEGRKLAGKYEVISQVGQGWEGEVYLVKETATGINMAAKFFFPQRNKDNKVLNNYAKKLHKLRNCRAVIQYRTQEKIRYMGIQLPFLVSDYIEGQILDEFLKEQRGKHLDYFQGLHFLRSLAIAVNEIHQHREYHGDLHSENVMIQRVGLGFEIKLMDFYPEKIRRVDAFKDDLCDVIRIFYDALGGRKRYARHPIQVKKICYGLKRSLILKNFRNFNTLLRYLDQIKW